LPLAGGRADVHDPAGTAGPHAGHGRPDRAHVAHDVQLPQRIPVIVCHLVEVALDGETHVVDEAVDLPETVFRGGDEPLGRAEVVEKGALAGRADTLQLIQHGPRHGAIPAASVMLDREPVGLVADPLEELRGLRVRRQADRRRAARDVDLLEPLGE